jgi:hypothetical protein
MLIAEKPLKVTLNAHIKLLDDIAETIRSTKLKDEEKVSRISDLLM